ncbi:hypothetical protein MKX03_011690 [Papaver bracteatum]|nr:hypothetical protein MKX03_011690 [Papaver bracteatum]
MSQTTPNHTQKVYGWAGQDESGKVTPLTFKRRQINQLNYCMHEITGVITKTGSNVKEFKVGDRVGVGCLACSCLKCEYCKDSQEQYCENHQFTYSGMEVSPMVVTPKCLLLKVSLVIY